MTHAVKKTGVSTQVGQDLLAPYEPTVAAPWNLARVRHLHWRAGFGATWKELTDGVDCGHEWTLTMLLEGKRTAGVPADGEDLIEALERGAMQSGMLERAQGVWIWRMLYSADPFGERLALHWHDHFATSVEKLASVAPLVRQNQIFREHVRGKFGDLLPAVIKHPAMLIWLDAASNYREHPNENLARELMELFTLGEGNYSETDVREVARALTGWRIDHRGRFWFYGEHHDGGEKQILGQTGEFDGDDVLDILLAHPAAPHHIARQLARTLLADELITADLVEALALDLAASDFDLGACVERIVRSRAFFAGDNLRAIPSSPIVYTVALTRALECFDPPARTVTLAEMSAAAGQKLYEPPSVFGWPHGEAWMTTGSLVGRARFARALVDGDVALGDDTGPVPRLLERHGISHDAGERVTFFCRLLVGAEPSASLRAVLVETASSGGPRACEDMVVQLCLSPACQLA